MDALRAQKTLIWRDSSAPIVPPAPVTSTTLPEGGFAALILRVLSRTFCARPSRSSMAIGRISQPLVGHMPSLNSARRGRRAQRVIPSASVSTSNRSRIFSALPACRRSEDGALRLDPARCQLLHHPQQIINAAVDAHVVDGVAGAQRVVVRVSPTTRYCAARVA